MSNNKVIQWHFSKITKTDRQRMNGHKSCVIWFTGLSGSGKSTLATELEAALFNMGIRSYVLDGDNIRHGLNKNLGFSSEDRKENIRRIGEVSKLFVDAGLITLSAFISPYREDRENVRALFSTNEFVEVYVKCSIEECERRDPKGLYAKARNGYIKEFTGITAPYEEPVKPEIIVETDTQSIEDCIQSIMNFLKNNELI
ncbi:adenylyl-sulfate kinase [Paenibacillus chartarius]|uniref:Adenylyl-sulfate kinase n=1 Tax=Paenibacillus chartarius TaxID=747481 RepID=A0ABV6DF09_9BACL